MNPTTAILMMAYGGPDSLDNIEPYLLDVRGGRPVSPELLEEIRQRYALIGGKSPLLEITRQQAQALENQLNSQPGATYKVFVGMRHWYPYIRETIAEIEDCGISKIIAICMTPFSSKMSTGAYFQHLDQAIDQQGNPDWKDNLTILRIGAWYSHPKFINGISSNLKDTLQIATEKGLESPQVIFTAHSLPAIVKEKGDPYADQFSELASLVADQTGLSPSQWTFCFQSAGANNIPWLGPSLEDTLQDMAHRGEKSVLIAPIGFLSDHVEILFDIDVEAKHLADQLNLQILRIPSPNYHPLFIQALANIILDMEQTS